MWEARRKASFTTGEASHATIISRQTSELIKKPKRLRTDHLGTLSMNQKRFKLGATRTFHVEILDDKMFKRFVQLDFTRIVSPNASATGVPTATFSSFASKRATLDLNKIGCFKSEHKHMRHISINTKQKLYGEFEEGIHVINNTAIIINYRFMDLYGTFVVISPLP